MTLGWEPDASLWADIDRLGIPRDFVQAQIPEFRRYWAVERPLEQRPGWERTLLAQVQRNWKREQETAGGTAVAPWRPTSKGHPSGRGEFRTWGELRQARNVAVSLGWADNEPHEDFIDAR